VVMNVALPQFKLWLPLLIAGFVLIAELVPVPMQIFSVKVFKRKIFPYTPIHHAFEKAGMKETRVVLLFLLTQILLIGIAYGVAASSADEHDLALSHPFIVPNGGPQP